MPKTVVMAKGRVEAFSDGVFAVAITLLILDIAVGEDVGNGDLLHSLGQLWFNYLAYAISFLTIGVMWVNHHNVFSMLANVDHGLLYRNLFLMAVVSFVPFPTSVLSRYVHGHGSANMRTAVVLYGLTMVALAVAFTLLWGYVYRSANIRNADINDKTVRAEFVRSAAGTGLYTLATVIALFVPVLSLALFALLVVSFAFARPGTRAT
jgi:uncharacterized membrane protein